MRDRLVLLSAALLAFGASLGAGFHFDDYAIFSDRAITSSRGWLEVWRLSQTRPLTYFTFWLNFQVGGGDPLGYHLVNLALHLGAVWLAYECFSRLLGRRPAVLAAALFAVHPIQVEAVNYVWARSTLLATLLCLASLACWLKGRYWTAVAWFAAALLAKEECAAFPLVLACFEWLRRKTVAAQRGFAASDQRSAISDQPGGKLHAGNLRDAERNEHLVVQAFVPVSAMLLLSLAAGARAIWAIAVTPGAPAGLQAGISPWKYLLAQGPVVLRYLRLLVVPYGFTVDPDVRVPALWVGLAAWATLAALAVIAWRRFGTAGRCLVAGLILLIPSSSIFPAADLAADRRMYLPMLAFAAAMALILEPLLDSRSQQPRRAAAAVLVVILMAVSLERTYVWMHEESLWREAVERAPGKVRPKIQLARALPAAKALELLAQARNLAPHDPSVAAETGKILLAEGQVDPALAEFGRALALDPRDARNFNNRGLALAALGQTEAARADFRRALEIAPGLIEAEQNLRKLQAP